MALMPELQPAEPLPGQNLHWTCPPPPTDQHRWRWCADNLQLLVAAVPDPLLGRPRRRPRPRLPPRTAPSPRRRGGPPPRRRGCRPRHPPQTAPLARSGRPRHLARCPGRSQARPPSVPAHPLRPGGHQQSRPTHGHGAQFRRPLQRHSLLVGTGRPPHRPPSWSLRTARAAPTPPPTRGPPLPGCFLRGPPAAAQPGHWQAAGLCRRRPSPRGPLRPAAPGGPGSRGHSGG
mmetsp:Transcript_20431/g.64228  ORF Transcript_20431/g.64228 Transcript_20431/m.64228 type:complete len:232 (-) Transcript_20431:267-962(-)